MSDRGPVSAHLEDDVLRQARKNGVVIWLDRDAHYTRFAEDLARRHGAGEISVPVVPHRGSFLETLFELDGKLDGAAQQALIVHVPGHHEDSIVQTPLLETYEVGTRYRKALDTLIREAAVGRATPAEVEALIAEPDLTLEKADRWLASRADGAGGQLDELLEGIGLDAVVRDLLVDGKALAARTLSEGDLDTIARFLERHVGMDAAWRSFMARGAKGLDALIEALAGWLLSMEYVDDLRNREPHLPELRRLRTLSKSVRDNAKAQVRRIREETPDRYAVLADEVEAHLAGELPHVHADDLGKIDTFRIEEARVLEAALADLLADRWQAAADKKAARDEAASIWLRQDPPRRFAWTLVGQAARFGQLLEAHPRPLQGATGHDDAADRYVRLAAEVDRAHREFEQTRTRYLEPRLPAFIKLKAVMETLRQRYRRWADHCAWDFTAVCRTSGFLPAPALQQRTFYEQVVHPLTTGGDRVAVLLVDALRFEMAAELAGELWELTGITVDLKPRYAELPTITAVGMNVLAPVAYGGRLSPVLSGNKITGFRAGEFTVRTPEDRARAMGERSIGRPALSLDLTDIVEDSAERLKRRLAQSPLIVVHGREIDDAGEADLGLTTFEQSLRLLRSACVHLLDAGVRHIVVTADHGFLLLDPTVELKPFGNRREPSRRHVFSTEQRADNGLVPVGMAAMGWDGATDHILFREDTALFDTGNAGASFAHGGNSPQERIIPVITATRRRERTANRTVFVLGGAALKPVLGYARVTLTLDIDRGQNESLGFLATDHVSISLRVPGRDDIQVLIKEVGGAGELAGERIRLRPNGTPAEVFLAVIGPHDERVRLEAFHPDGKELVRPHLVEGWFDAVGAKETTQAARPAPVPDDWATAIADEGARRIFIHIGQHGSITEEEIVRLLGTPRAARRFAASFDELLQYLPFVVRIEPTERGKRYVKEREI